MKFAYYYCHKTTKDVKRYIFGIEEIEYLDRYFDDLKMAFSSFADFDKYLMNEGYELIERARCTGFKDVSKTDIFEGDIIRHFAGELGVVTFQDECVGVRWSNDDFRIGVPFEVHKVIGNIYQHATLLTRGDMKP